MTKYIVLGLVAVQMAMAYALRNTAFFSWQFWVCAYLVGGTVNQALFLGIHEITHNLAFKSILANRLFAMIANIPIGIPYAMAFKGYHNEHHKYQGEVGVDTDLPTKLEGLLFENVLTKTLFWYIVFSKH